MSSLPIEIKAAIIDCIADQKHSLSAIALVWPDVLFRIRERRFNSFKLRSTKRIAGLLDILQSNPAISPLIQSIRITNSSIYAEPKLPRLFELLSNVSIARCLDIHYSSGTQATLHAFSGPYNSVKDAVLHFRRRSGMTRLSVDIDGLSYILQRLPNVEQLMLDFYPDPHRVAAGGRIQTQLVALRSLSLPPQVLAAPTFLDQFLETIVLPNIRALIIGDLAHPASLNRALRFWGNSLKELHLQKHHYNASLSDIDPSLTLFLSDSIEVVEFSIIIGDGTAEDAYIGMWTRTLEDCARSQYPTLRSIGLEVEFWQDRHETILTLVHRFDAAIASPQLAVNHLDWKLELGKDELSPESLGVYETFFPQTHERFLSPMGQMKYGTTCKVEY
ncbi:hypothetical protein CYLTODRAFT_494905 [Cylindrobasidium torrendii FP15055 ss-10]|uniref:F-box domain-containing protein n=1 Tax=Cylindrobasidium torrendii FP15055 ss-10 TaxID=1314674 RepID=A0A0D7AVL8_9AGAR|nr:hypothetical protein CYLTODRAFT_494905 [Cylindrobasidium torrendii FP15055 ss-10]